MLAWEMMIEHGGATEGTGGVGSGFTAAGAPKM